MLSYTDNNGYAVHVGTIVGWREMFGTPEMADKAYFVVDLPNCADMVEMVEITDIDYNVTTNEQKYVVVVPVQVISVEPWKIGAI